MKGTWKGVIAVEGATTVDGRRVDLEGFWWTELPLPLKEQADEGQFHGRIIGTVDEIRREGHLIIGEGRFTEDHGKSNGLGVDVTDADFEPIDGILHLHRGRIRQVWIERDKGPAWPECQITEEG